MTATQMTAAERTATLDTMRDLCFEAACAATEARCARVEAKAAWDNPNDRSGYALLDYARSARRAERALRADADALNEQVRASY